MQFIGLLDADTWEQMLGGLMGLAEILKANSDSDTVQTIYAKASGLVFHQEYRVRIAAGQLLGVMLGISPALYEQFKTSLFSEIESSFTPEITSDDPLANEHVIKGGAGW